MVFKPRFYTLLRPSIATLALHWRYTGATLALHWQKSRGQTDGLTPSPTPVLAPSPAPAKLFAVGDFQTCRIDTDGKLFCYGMNVNGALGLGVSTYGPIYLNPQTLQVGTLSNWTVVSTYNVNVSDVTSACGVAGNSSYCWGANNYGQLGFGNTSMPVFPMQPLPW